MKPSMSPSSTARRVADLVLGAQVLDHLVRVQHVGAHLVAPRRAGVLEGVHLGLLLLAAALEQLGLQHHHRRGLVLQLAALVLAGDDDAGGQVGQAHRGVGGVHALTAGARRPVDVDAQVLLVDVDVVGGLDDGCDLDAGERRLPAALVVERGDAHQPVRALLDRQRPVGERRVDLEGRRLDAGLLRVGGVVDVGAVAVPLGPAQVHAHEHLGEVGGVDAAGLGADRHQRLAGVVLAREQRADLEALDVVAQLGALGVGVGERPDPIGPAALLLGQLVEHGQVVEAAAQLLDAAQVALGVREPAVDLLRGLGVVPQVRAPGLLGQVRDLGAQRGAGPSPPRCSRGWWRGPSTRPRRRDARAPGYAGPAQSSGIASSSLTMARLWATAKSATARR